MSSSLDSYVFQTHLYCYVFLFPTDHTTWNYRAFGCFPRPWPCWFLPSPSNFVVPWLLTWSDFYNRLIRICKDNFRSSLFKACVELGFWFFLFLCSWTIKEFGFFCHSKTLQTCHPQGSFVYSANFLTRWYVWGLPCRFSDMLSQTDSFLFPENMFNFSVTSIPPILQHSQFSSGFVLLVNFANVPVDIQ